jgi:hypothetical protein
MIKAHENKMTMYLGFSEILNQYRDIIQTLPAFKTAQEEFNQKIEAIKTKSKEKDALTAGKTLTKNEARASLIGKVTLVAASLFARAVDSGNNELKARTNLRKYYLEHCRDTQIIQIAESVHETATQQVTELASYGVQPETLTDLFKQLQEYMQAFGDREQSVARRKTARLALQDLFCQTDEVLKNHLDRLVENFKATHPEFYGAYRSGRRIKNLSGVRRGKTEAEPAEPMPK